MTSGEAATWLRRLCRGRNSDPDLCVRRRCLTCGGMGRALTVTAKGQVTLRREVLRHLDVRPGDRIVVDLLPSGRAELRAATSDLSEFFGCLPARGRSVSIEEMNRAVEDGWTGVGEDHT